MKILIVASTFPASDTDPVPAFVKDQAITLKKLHPKAQITVLAPHDARANTKRYTQHQYYDEYRFSYAWPKRLQKLAGRGIWPQIQKQPAYALLIPALFICEFFALWRLARTLQPDYSYAHWLTPQGIVARMLLPFNKTPYVITTHASDAAVWHKIPFGGTIVRSAVAKASAITAVSPRTLDKLKSFYSDKQWNTVAAKTKIIPMGVHLSKAKPSQRKPGQNILFIGRLAEKKGVHYLLPAFAKIANRFPKALLTIAGDGPMLEELQQQAKELQIPSSQIQFTGHISGNNKQRYIDNADVYAIPSIITEGGDAEGLPVAFMEGLAAGKVCIATNESGADNIIKDKRDGFLIPQKDTEALEKALTNALTLSDKERKAIQQNAQKAAGRFNWEKVAQEHYEFFKAQLDKTKK